MKHGLKIILLKLLTILLFGSPFRWWTKQQLTAGRIPQQSQLKRLMSLARRPFRAISAKIAGLAGTNQFKMFATVNTKKLQNHGVLRPRRGLAVSWAPCVSDQVISSEVRDGARERASWSGPHEVASDKQVTSSKLQASIKLSNQPVQASSHKPLSHKHRLQATSHKRQAP